MSENSSWLGDYCCSQPGMFVVPLERLARGRIEPPFREELLERGVTTEGWLDLFERSFETYWARTRRLAAQTGLYCFPPRVQHLCVVTDPEQVRPYFQPFFKASWLLYESDFDPQLSNVEFGVLQLLQTERAGLMQDLAPVFGCNLSYLLTLDTDEREALTEACERATRPDAGFYRSLGKALDWIPDLFHEVLKPAPAEDPDAVTIQGTGLVIPKARHAAVRALIEGWTRSFQSVAHAHYARHAKRTRNHAQEVGAWLRSNAPRVLVTGADGRILWDPAQAEETREIVRALKGVGESAARSLCADLEVCGARSQAFLDALQDPAALPSPVPESADQNGLSYMHLERREIAYNVREASMHRLHEPAPPFERFMLGARTTHEWGHLAAEAGWIRPEDPAALETGVTTLATCLDEIVDAAPAQLARMCAPSLRLLKKGDETPGSALARLALSRISDYQSNLVSQRFLSREERDTYVRNNIRTLVHEFPRQAFFQRLVRYAYDYQYLRFASIEDPRAYFLRSTWFEEQYLTPGLLSQEHFERLFESMDSVCGTYAVDGTRFKARTSH